MKTETMNSVWTKKQSKTFRADYIGDAECPGYHTGSHELVATVDGRFVECQGCLTYYATT